MGIIRRLGLESAVNALASAPRSIEIADGISGRPLTSIELGPAFERQYGAPYLTIHRGDLQSVLVERCRSAGVELTLGYAAVARTDRNAVSFANETYAHHDLTVVANGINSRLVKDVDRGTSGFVAWRALVASRELPDGLHSTRTGLWLAPNAHLVHYPVRSGTETNVVLVLARGIRPSEATFSPVPSALVRRIGDWKDWPIEDRLVRGRWTDAGFAIIGDAAHAMWPYAAQGGAMAIEDGWTLAVAVKRGGARATALREWEATRRDRVGSIAAIARRNRRIYHAYGPVRVARNVVMRSVPPRLLSRGMRAVYSWEAPSLSSP